MANFPIGYKEQGPPRITPPSEISVDIWTANHLGSNLPFDNRESLDCIFSQYADFGIEAS